MPISFTMNDRQRQKVGLNVLDQDGQPLTSLPDGASFAMSTSDENVAKFVKDDTPVTGPNGETYAVTGDVVSGKVGTAQLSAALTFADGTSFADTAAIAVTNSAAASVGFATIGEPKDEA